MGFGIAGWGLDTGGGGSGETVKPVVTVITPYVNDPYDPIVVDVTDNAGLARIAFSFEYKAIGIIETAFDGDAFSLNFSRRGSYRQAISQGWRYYFVKLGGWPHPPTLRYSVVDTSGNVAL